MVGSGEDWNTGVRSLGGYRPYGTSRRERWKWGNMTFQVLDSKRKSIPVMYNEKSKNKNHRLGLPKDGQSVRSASEIVQQVVWWCLMYVCRFPSFAFFLSDSQFSVVWSCSNHPGINGKWQLNAANSLPSWSQTQHPCVISLKTFLKLLKVHFIPCEKSGLFFSYLRTLGSN